jgi:hypothetical protein
VVKAIPRELHVWEKLQHPNILQLEGFAIVDGFPSFISEWMENGTLNRFISANPKYDVRAMVSQRNRSEAAIANLTCIAGFTDSGWSRVSSQERRRACRPQACS